MQARYIEDHRIDELELVVINGCETGLFLESEVNLLRSFSNQGVNLVIGFNKTVWVADSNWWGQKFWESTSNGIGVRDAAKKAALSREKLLWSRLRYSDLVILPVSGNDLVIIPAPPRDMLTP
jgi:hypothetical protein